MKRRILTYDIKKENDYTNLYNWFNEINAEKITESTYLTNTELTQNEYENKIKSLINKNDNISYISVSSDKNLFYKKVSK